MARGVNGAGATSNGLLFCVGLGLFLSGCAGIAPGPEPATPTVAMPAWQGKSWQSLQARMGPDSVAQQLANGHTRLRYQHNWVLGAAGERYRIVQDDYPTRAAGSPGGFNAKLLRCYYQFEVNPAQTVLGAWVSDPLCPQPSL